MSEAIEQVAKIYLPGTADYYGKLSPDPWQDAHERLSKFAGIFGGDDVSEACHTFVNRCRELLRRFRMEGPTPEWVSFSDAFAIGNEQRLNDEVSLIEKCCAVCGEKTGLTISPRPEEPLKTRLVCLKHKGAK